ncbi:MAG TPA: CAP domain-containing protein [Campylobacterales bacterium]|nr:CAP domain-containing protein [Campylobacterales bacterium]
MMKEFYMKKVNINILILLIGLIFSGCSTEKSTNGTNVVNTHNVVISDQLKNAYISELNRVRSIPQDCASRGIYYATTPLTWNDKLYNAAYEHSYDMATSNTFSHTGSGQATDTTGVKLGKASTFKERIVANGYKSYSSIGENIASGTTSDTAKKVVAQLMASDGHCANIMNSNYKEVGMAVSKNTNSKYTHYWTQNFGTRR